MIRAMNLHEGEHLLKYNNPFLFPYPDFNLNCLTLFLAIDDSQIKETVTESVVKFIILWVLFGTKYLSLLLWHLKSDSSF